MTKRIFPDELTEDLQEILGMPNFACGPIAHTFQAAGFDIPKKAEAEQAFVLHWLTNLFLKYGKGWRTHAAHELTLAKESAQRNKANPTTGAED